MNGEIISESELKKRINSIPQFIFEQKNEHINTAKLSLNIWIVINSGTASAVMVKGFFSAIPLIAFLCGIICSSIGYIGLYLYSQHSYQDIITYLKDERNINGLLLKQYSLNKCFMYWCMGSILLSASSYIVGAIFLFNN